MSARDSFAHHRFLPAFQSSGEDGHPPSGASPSEHLFLLAAWAPVSGDEHSPAPSLRGGGEKRPQQPTHEGGGEGREVRSGLLLGAVPGCRSQSGGGGSCAKEEKTAEG